MSSRRASLLRLLLGIAVILLLLAALDPREVVARLGRADPLLATLGITGLTVVHLLAAATWRILCRDLAGVNLSWRTAIATYYASQALGGVTPANLGGDAYRAWWLRRRGHPVEIALWPVLIQRATSFLALCALAGLGLVAIASVTGAAPPVAVAALAVAIVASAAAILLLYAPSAVRGAGWRLQSWQGITSSDADGGCRIGSPPPPRRVAAAVSTASLFGIAFHAASIGLSYLVVLAVSPGASPLPTLAALAVGRLALAVPFTPSGAGLQEGLVSLLFAGLGMPPTAGLAATLLNRLAQILTGVVGAATLVMPRQPSLLDGRGHRAQGEYR